MNSNYSGYGALNERQKALSFIQLAIFEEKRP